VDGGRVSRWGGDHHAGRDSGGGGRERGEAAPGNAHGDSLMLESSITMIDVRGS
jgi:hypothetical protein